MFGGALPGGLVPASYETGRRRNVATGRRSVDQCDRRRRLGGQELPAPPPAGPQGLFGERLVPPLVRTVLLADLSSHRRSCTLGRDSSPPAGNVEVLGRLPRGWPLGRTIATWLILPVVICLSQRLSHACPSISFYIVKLRMAH